MIKGLVNHFRSGAVMLLKLLLLSVLSASCCFAAEPDPHELPKVPVEVFYSKDDPAWPAAEKVIDAVEKDLPDLKVEKISVDTPEGYKKLAAAEKDLFIKDTGDLTLVMGPLFLTSKGERRDVEKFFGPMAARLLKPDGLKGKVTADVAAYVKDVFGADAMSEAQPPGENEHIEFHRVKKAEKFIGWIVHNYTHIFCPVCNDAQFMVAVSSPELKVIGIKPVRELERWGAKLDDKEATAYLDQFKGRTPDDADKKVDAISRATKTSVAYEKAIKAILAELKKRESK
jgi:hypothetical protein